MVRVRFASAVESMSCRSRHHDHFASQTVTVLVGSLIARTLVPTSIAPQHRATSKAKDRRLIKPATIRFTRSPPSASLAACWSFHLERPHRPVANGSYLTIEPTDPLATAGHLRSNWAFATV